jgi:hypothetical protein
MVDAIYAALVRLIAVVHNMWGRKPYPLQAYIDRYVEDRAKRYPSDAGNHREWLQIFCELIQKQMAELTTDDIDTYLTKIHELFPAEYSYYSASKALRAFLRYYRSRGHKYLPGLHNLKDTYYEQDQTRRATREAGSEPQNRAPAQERPEKVVVTSPGRRVWYHARTRRQNLESVWWSRRR